MTTAARKPVPRGPLRAPAACAAAAFAVQFLVAPGYGIFRDELYYIACAKRLGWGYVDQPPLSIALLALQRLVLPDAVLALKLLPALAGAITVYLVGALAARLGGRDWAQAAASLAALVAPVYLAIFGFFSMNAFDVLIWTVCFWLIARTIDTGGTRWWAWLGIALGLGLQNKISVLWLGAGLAAALLLTAQRRALATPGPWLAAALAGLIALPHLLWQIAHGWPTLEFISNAARFKNAEMPLSVFLGQQVLFMNPVALPLWLGGLLWLLLAPSARRWRPFAVIFVAVFLMLAASGSSKPYYLAASFPPLLAAGGVALSRLAHRRRALAATYLAALGVAGVALAPMAMPVLAPASYAAYARAIGIQPAAQERNAVGELPQHLADRLGWPELAAEVARVVETLTPEERAGAVIYATNYGRAGAIELYGERWGLPPVASGHNSWWLWGPPRETPRVIVIVGGRIEDHREALESVELVATHRCALGMPFEREVPIFVGRGWKRPFSEVWLSTKEFI
ncbi:MAG: glycosyltransferase family 39 protein [Acidobacteria bacterium]|nr:glycosyltransferase family 39 protein [Acidobacteriota bacterium]